MLITCSHNQHLVNYTVFIYHSQCKDHTIHSQSTVVTVFESDWLHYAKSTQFTNKAPLSLCLQVIGYKCKCTQFIYKAPLSLCLQVIGCTIQRAPHSPTKHRCHCVCRWLVTNANAHNSSTKHRCHCVCRWLVAQFKEHHTRPQITVVTVFAGGGSLLVREAL